MTATLSSSRFNSILMFQIEPLCNSLNKIALKRSAHRMKCSSMIENLYQLTTKAFGIRLTKHQVAIVTTTSLYDSNHYLANISFTIVYRMFKQYQYYLDTICISADKIITVLSQMYLFMFVPFFVCHICIHSCYHVNRYPIFC